MTETKKHSTEEIKAHVAKREEEHNRMRLYDPREASISYDHIAMSGLIQEYNYADLKPDNPHKIACRIVNDTELPAGITRIEIDYSPSIASLAKFLNEYLGYHSLELTQKALKNHNEMMQDDPSSANHHELLATIHKNLDEATKKLNQIKSSIEPFKHHHYNDE